MAGVRLWAGVISVVLAFDANAAVSQSAARTAYVTNCQACHGATGAGETPTGKILKVKPFNDPQVVGLADAAISSNIARGLGKMPPFKNILSNDQISSLVQYMHQLQANLQTQ
jgi:mono/diheme cytochrome c family protein